MLVAGRIPCFGTRPDTVKELGTFLQIKAQTLEMVVPVGILDDYLYTRIHLLGRFQHKVAPGFSHQLQTVFRPALRTFGFYLYVRLATGEEKVIQNKLVKSALPYVLQSFAPSHDARDWNSRTSRNCLPR